MRKRIGKLELNRETLRRLGFLDLRRAGGAATDTGPHQVSENYSACPLDCGTGTGPIPSGPFYPGCAGYTSSCTADC